MKVDRPFSGVLGHARNAFNVVGDLLRLLTTIELRPEGERTVLTLTEQGAFFDGLDSPARREHGTGSLLDALARAIQGDGQAG